MPPLSDVSGRRFGRLVVQRRIANNKRGLAVWECRCDCGALHPVLGAELRNGHTRSCGCLARDLLAARRTTHGETRGRRSPSLYRTWVAMRQRCTNPRALDYRYYGGRGITICERWSDFAAFRADVGDRPSPKHTIDRIDNNGNYEPGNIRWATHSEQMKNRRSWQRARRALQIVGVKV